MRYVQAPKEPFDGLTFRSSLQKVLTKAKVALQQEVQAKTYAANKAEYHTRKATLAKDAQILYDFLKGTK